MTEFAKPTGMTDDELDLAVGGGHSQCEGDDGRGSGGSSGGGGSGGNNVRTVNNQLTSFIDASSVY